MDTPKEIWAGGGGVNRWWEPTETDDGTRYVLPSPWIPVSERLPDPAIAMWAWTGKHIHTAAYFAELAEWLGPGGEVLHPTHWRLPDPPKSDT